MVPEIKILECLNCDRCGGRGLVQIKDSKEKRDVIICPKCSWEWRTKDFRK